MTEKKLTELVEDMLIDLDVLPMGRKAIISNILVWMNVKAITVAVPPKAIIGGKAVFKGKKLIKAIPLEEID